MSRDGRYFSVFRGIPYAKPPVGDLRFRPPEPLDEHDNWEGFINFNRDMETCYQVNSRLGVHVGSENCLQLNVYTPDVSPSSPLPVMVYIHGGGFVSFTGASAIQGPGFFMDHDVVLVSVNYRLGIFGFLSLETDDVPGNLGLWDQTMALNWVKQNIAKFGGDPRKVTIFGESAGSMSVNYHLLSRQSRGLFHRAIMQSGTAISPYTRLNKSPRYYAEKLADNVGCGQSDNILKCLQSTPAKQLYQHMQMFDECSLRADYGLTYPGAN